MVINWHWCYKVCVKKLILLKTTLCTNLGKTGIKDITASDIKNCGKLNKELLSDNLLDLIELSDNLCSHDTFDLISDSQNNISTVEKLNNISAKLNDVNKTISEKLNTVCFDSIKSQLDELTKSVA